MRKVDSTSDSASNSNNPMTITPRRVDDQGNVRAPEISVPAPEISVQLPEVSAPRAPVTPAAKTPRSAPRPKRSAPRKAASPPAPAVAVETPRSSNEAQVSVPAFMASESSGTSFASAAMPNPMEERLRQVQLERAKARQKPDGKEVWEGLVRQGKAFATQLIKGKPQVSRSAKDFPINRGIFGRLKRYGPAKVYRLKGYTTIGRVKKKRAKDALKRNRNRLLMFGVIALCIMIAYFVIDPIPRIKQILYDIGY